MESTANLSLLHPTPWLQEEARRQMALVGALTRSSFTAPRPLDGVSGSQSGSSGRLPSLIYPLEGVLVEGTPDLYPPSVLIDEEADAHELVVAEIHPEMLSSSSMPPTRPLNRGPGDQTRPRIIVMSDDSNDEESCCLDSPSATPGNNMYGSGTTSAYDDQGGDDGREEERTLSLSETRERAEHDVRVAIADRCFHPRPTPIARYSGPMTVVRLDRMAALSDFQMAEEGKKDDEGEDIVQPLAAYAGMVDWAQAIQREPCSPREAEDAPPN